MYFQFKTLMEVFNNISFIICYIFFSDEFKKSKKHRKYKKLLKYKRNIAFNSPLNFKHYIFEVF